MTNQKLQPPPAYSDRQLKTLALLRQNRQAWILFWFLLVAFSVILGFFLYAAFWRQNAWLAETILGPLDGIVGWAMKDVVKFLFPANMKEPE